MPQDTSCGGHFVSCHLTRRLTFRHGEGVIHNVGTSASAYGLPAGADGFAVAVLACAADPDARAQGSQYGAAGFALVEDGAFAYRARGGMGLAAPGAIVFANSGEPFECQHVDRSGNKRLALFLSHALMDEIAGELGAETFPVALLAASREAAAVAGLMRKAAAGGPERAPFVFAAVEAGMRLGGDARPRRASGRDEARILSVTRHVRAHFDEPCALDVLAALAGMSRFHFARTFKAVTGQTPAQYVLHTRLSAASAALEQSARPVADIAFSVGFNDLSHFNASFKRAFGMSPRAWRAH